MVKKTALIKRVYKGIIISGLLIPGQYILALGACGSAICNPLNSPDFATLVDAIAKIVMGIGGVIAVIFIIYAGFLFVTARGNEKKITDAKATFTWTILGTAVLLGAYVIAAAIVNLVKSL